MWEFASRSVAPSKRPRMSLLSASGGAAAAAAAAALLAAAGHHACTWLHLCFFLIAADRPANLRWADLQIACRRTDAPAMPELLNCWTELPVRVSKRANTPQAPAWPHASQAQAGGPSVPAAPLARHIG